MGLLERLCRTAFVRRALETQLFAARRFVGAAIPERFIARDWTKLQHWRHELQFRYPGFAIPLAVIGLISELPSFLAHHSEDRAGRRRVLGGYGPRPLTVRLRRLRRILSSPPGKI